MPTLHLQQVPPPHAPGEPQVPPLPDPDRMPEPVIDPTEEPQPIGDPGVIDPGPAPEITPPMVA